MQVQVEQATEAGPTVVAVSGDVDVFTAPGLREALSGPTGETGRHVVVDLRKVEFLDSSGLGVLVYGLKRARERGGDLTLVCQQPNILRVLEITGLDKVLRVSDSVNELPVAANGEAH